MNEIVTEEMHEQLRFRLLRLLLRGDPCFELIRGEQGYSILGGNPPIALGVDLTLDGVEEFLNENAIAVWESLPIAPQKPKLVWDADGNDPSDQGGAP